MLIMNGESTHESKIGAYRALLGTWEYQGGVDYFVVGWKIPHEEEIYDEPEVIDMMNAHHALRGMGPAGTHTDACQRQSMGGFEINDESPTRLRNGARHNNQALAAQRHRTQLYMAHTGH